MASSFVRFNHTRQSTRTAKHDPTTTFPRRYANTASLWRARNWRPSSPGHVHRTGSEEQLTPIKACRSHLFGRQGKRTKRLAAALIRVVSAQKGVDGAVARRVPDRLLVGRLECLTALQPGGFGKTIEHGLFPSHHLIFPDPSTLGCADVGRVERWQLREPIAAMNGAP